MFNQALKSFARLAVTPCAVFVFVAGGQAADNFRYISSTGNNANPCTLAQPCRTLQRGVQATPPGGELRFLDSGFFGNNGTINKTMSVAGNGNTIHLGSPITINRVNATVALRGLVLNGEGATANGINIIASAAVHIEHCVVHSFTADGISVAGAVNVSVIDSVSRDNGGNGLVTLGVAGTTLTVDNSQFENNGGHGIFTTDTEAAVSRATVLGNDTGIQVNGGRMNVTSSTAAHNNNGYRVAISGQLTVESSVARGRASAGLDVASGTTGRISNSTFTNNGTGVFVRGTLVTRENNTLSGNTFASDINAGGVLSPVAGF
jgi:Right handed beta helix region